MVVSIVGVLRVVQLGRGCRRVHSGQGSSHRSNRRCRRREGATLASSMRAKSFSASRQCARLGISCFGECGVAVG